MPDLKLEIKNCYHCPWKTEYFGDPEDYWMCDQVPGRRIPKGYLVEDSWGVPWFCPWKPRPKPTARQWFWILGLTIKYWCQGDGYEEAKSFATALVMGWKR